MLREKLLNTAKFSQRKKKRVFGRFENQFFVHYKIWFWSVQQLLEAFLATVDCSYFCRYCLSCFICQISFPAERTRTYTQKKPTKKKNTCQYQVNIAKFVLDHRTVERLNHLIADRQYLHKRPFTCQRRGECPPRVHPIGAGN